MKWVLTLSSFFIGIVVCAQAEEAPVSPCTWKQNWKTEIGLTSYRTNMLMHKGFLFVGSNGDDRNGNNDPKDGVYIINPKDGSVKYQIKGLSLDDNDVNGLAISSNDVLYFGGDAHYVFAYDLNTYKEIWKYKVPNDIEGVPALADLNGDGNQDVIVNVEGKGIWALDGLSGDVIWRNEIRTHNGNVSPVAIDLNEDGTPDIICGGNGYFALNGRSGEILWVYKKNSGVHASPLVILQGDSIQIHFVSSYRDYDILDKNGKPKAGAGLSYGLFSSPSPSGESNYIAVATSWYSSNSVKSFSCNMEQWNWEEDKGKFGPGERSEYHSQSSERVSATAISLDVDGDGNMEFLLPDEEGTLYVIHPEKEEIELIKMPVGAEASLAVLDTNNDGKYQLYYAGLDGNLYCYELNKAQTVVWNSFRGKNNNGILDL